MSKPSTIRRIVAITALAALAACQPAPEGNPPPPRPKVSVVTLRPQSVTITAELPGRVAASQEAQIRPQVAGIIQARLFEEGKEVAQDAVLYQIAPAPFQAAYDSAVAAQQKAEAAVPSAQARVDRYQTLSQQNAVSRQDLDDAVAALAQAKAEVAASKANAETAAINLDFSTIRAPIAGRADKSSLTPGALVTAGQTTLLTTIRKLDPIYVDVTQSSTNFLNMRRAIEAGRIKLDGSGVKVRLKLENGAMYPINGRFGFAEANVNAGTGTFTLRAEFKNPDRLLLPGMYVRAIVEEGVAPNSYLVPQRAVTRNVKGEATALFLGKDDKVEERNLTIDRNVGNYWLVTSGAGDGDRVVVEGSQFVRPGQPASGSEVFIDETTGEVFPRKAGTTDKQRNKD
jgi:membrane fusion protein (multidrug efflux system)